MATKQDQVALLYQALVDLTASPLYEYRIKNNYQPVIGEGNLDAQIMFVGEAPGENEAKTGRPFTGAAGNVLDSLLAGIQIERSDVYISNIINDRPPGNRDPLPEEIELYSPFLLQLLKIIQPKILATLGRFSMKFMLELCHIPDANRTISQLHGQAFKTRVSYGSIILIPLYHPAVALYNGSQRSVLEHDMAILKKIADTHT